MRPTTRRMSFTVYTPITNKEETYVQEEKQDACDRNGSGCGCAGGNPFAAFILHKEETGGAGGGDSKA